MIPTLKVPFLGTCLVHTLGIGDRDALVAALAGGHAADEACREELLAGATFDVPDKTAPVANLVVIYRRRVSHLQSRGVRFVGDDVADRLEGSGLTDARIPAVRGQDHYAVFLDPHQDQVLACIGVDGSIGNPEFIPG